MGMCIWVFVGVYNYVYTGECRLCLTMPGVSCCSSILPLVLRACACVCVCVYVYVYMCVYMFVYVYGYVYLGICGFV